LRKEIQPIQIISVALIIWTNLGNLQDPGRKTGLVLSLNAVAIILAVNYNVCSSSIATIVICRTHIKILIEDCNYDYCRKQL
jgi:hypothetical protein